MIQVDGTLDAAAVMAGSGPGSLDQDSWPISSPGGRQGADDGGHLPQSPSKAQARAHTQAQAQVQVQTQRNPLSWNEMTPEQQLFVVSSLAQGWSGRGLRKLPLKAHSFHIQRPQVCLSEFLRAMACTLEQEGGGEGGGDM